MGKSTLNHHFQWQPVNVYGGAGLPTKLCESLPIRALGGAGDVTLGKFHENPPG